jgi:hypothetical protein
MRVKLMEIVPSAESAAHKAQGKGREAAEALGWNV